MSRKINELAEIVLDHVYTLGYQHRSDIGKHHETADELVAVQRQLRETKQELQRLRQVHLESQSEEVAAARAEIETLRKERDHWKEARQDAIDAGELMQAEIETLRQENETLKTELNCRSGKVGE